MSEYININDVKEKDVLFMPAKIQFNTMNEWREFEEKYNPVLSKRRDWYFNSKTLQFVQ